MKMRIRISTLIVIFLLLMSANSTVQAASQLPTMWVTPLELDFGPVGVGSTSPQLIVTITNIGNIPLTSWAGGGLASPFSASQDCNIPGGVLPGNHCHYYFTFSPTAIGTFSATSSSSTNLGSFSIIVHGTGVGASASYDTHALDFGSVYTNGSTSGTAPTQVVTITNTGLAPLTNWAGGGVSAPFGASQDCNIPGGVLPGDSCHYFFTFSTTSTSSFTATSSTSTNGGLIIVELSGRGHKTILPGGGQQVTPLSLDFGPVGVGKTSSQLEVTITNLDIRSNISGWAGGGVGGPFSASQDCNVQGGITPGLSCHFYYTFNPTARGSFSAVSSVSDSFGSFNIDLHGKGVAPSQKADALWLDFGPVTLNTTGVHQIVTITNTGLSPLTNWAGGGVNPPFTASQDCNIPGGVQPGNSCHFYYNFKPTESGFFSTTSSISTNAGTITVKLQGGKILRFFLPLIHR